MTTGRDLLRMQNRVPNHQAPVLIGNPAFDAESPNAEMSTKAPLNGRRSSDYAVGKYQPLPGAEKEIDELGKLFSQPRILKGLEATESEIKKLTRPKILHIATHGFFLPDKINTDSALSIGYPNKADQSSRENPMLRSGLAMAGANKKQSGDEDGILTAFEVAGLDLTGTSLVVLSACETGLGDMKNGEGVYGLRRALVLAGSESQLISLWAVSDEGTRELMRDYYKGLLGGYGRSQALRNVQLQMIKNEKRKHPYYWASFIQSGEGSNLEGK